LGNQHADTAGPQLVARNPISNLLVYRMPDGFVLAVAPAGRGGRPIVVSGDYATIEDGLRAAGVLHTYQRINYLRCGRVWVELASAAAVRPMLSAVFALGTHVGQIAEVEASLAANVVGETCLEQLTSNGAFLLSGDIPNALAASLCAEQHRWGAEAAGILRHPIHGEPEAVWIQDATDITVPKETDYRHLKRLYEGLKLDADSHTALYCYLFGAFSAVSLDAPRPILLVDSWQQGRGKSEVCGSVRRLVDDNDSAITARADTDKFDDSLVAALRGSRALALDNVDGMVEYNPSLLANGSTGSLEVRHKYGRGTTRYKGVLLLLNLVCGAASFHRDMLSRMVRVELRGSNERLDPAPLAYSQIHRREIIGELLHALRESAGRDCPCSSRFAAFDSVAVAGYAHVFQEDVETVAARLDAARRSVWAHHPDVLAHFAVEHRESFVYVARRVLPDEGFTNPHAADKMVLPREAQGARLFGHELKGKAWETS